MKNFIFITKKMINFFRIYINAVVLSRHILIRCFSFRRNITHNSFARKKVRHQYSKILNTFFILNATVCHHEMNHPTRTLCTRRQFIAKPKTHVSHINCSQTMLIHFFSIPSGGLTIIGPQPPSILKAAPSGAPATPTRAQLLLRQSTQVLSGTREGPSSYMHPTSGYVEARLVWDPSRVQ